MTGSAQGPHITVGVDVGGTFTDVFVLNTLSGEASVAKVPTTRPDQSSGFLQGIEQQVSDFADLSVVVHGTTAATNALLERKGANTGVITTSGLRDVLEMRRRDRPRTWGLRGDFEPIVDRVNRIEVPERTLADGTIRTAVDLEAVKEAAQHLLNNGCEAVAILFANAYANAENEIKAARVVRALWPNPHVSTSAEILPEIREFERFSTAALNAYLQPEVSGYLQRLEAALTAQGCAGEFLLVQSNGGVMSIATAQQFPVRTALSGPAAGVIAAAHIAKSAGFEHVITGDVGGTSFDVSLINDGGSVLSAQTSIDFGMVVRTPMIEITTIGAGGGSIAWVDEGGLLNVGPHSAGSNPGPVAYGLGNDKPTVTDANIVLGRIDANSPIGGKLTRLDSEAAAAAIDACVGKPLKLDTIAAAEAILRVANARMAGAIRLVSIERGFDPKKFVFMPFGGGGALHAGAMLEEVGISKALVPRYPGVTSAMGCVIADMRQDFVQTLNTPVESLDESALITYIQQHVNEGMALLSASNTVFESRQVSVTLDMAYAGQTHTLAVRIPVQVSGEVALPIVSPIARQQIESAFDTEYANSFSRLLPAGIRRIINVRTAITGVRAKFDLTTLAPPAQDANAAHSAKPTSTRDVHFANQWFSTAIYRRLELPIGTVIKGPAILEQPDTTVLVEPHLQARVDSFGNTIIEVQGLEHAKP